MAKASNKILTPAATDRFRFQYAAKFICMSDIPGSSQQSAGLLPGNYETSVNIHSPGKTKAKIRMKLARGGVITPWKKSELKYDEATQVNCGQVQDFGVTFIHGFEGFLVIESTQSLDVIAVYTASAVGGQVSSIDVEAVRERKI